MRMDRATVGPWEAKRQLAHINRRHERGRFVSALRAELIRDQGGDPSAARLLLIDMATFCALQVSRIVTPYLARDQELTPEQREDLARWQREVRDTLQVLGIDRIDQAPPALAELLEAKRKARAA